MRSAITVTIWREDLVKLGACEEGLGMFDRIAGLAGSNGVLQWPQWTPLHDVWLSKSRYAGWLRNCRLVPEPNLRMANLRMANLRMANLRRADLRGANLRGADLGWADLYGADLGLSDLYDANLRGANLRDANLRDVDLRDANLCGANLEGALRSTAPTGWESVDGVLRRASS